MDSQTVKQAFEQLASTFDRLVVDLSANSFMLMSMDQEWYKFKHCNTRNYLFVSIKDGSLHIPCSGKPFEQGIFH